MLLPKKAKSEKISISPSFCKKCAHIFLIFYIYICPFSGNNIMRRRNMNTNIRIKEKLKSRVILYRLAFLIVCGACILLHFKFNDEVHNIKKLGYFTIQSNILCFVTMLTFVIRDLKGRSLSTPACIFFKGMSTSAIICTGYIYHFAEAINKYPLEEYGIFSIPLPDLLAHYFIPVLFVLDWILFQQKGLFQKQYIFQWLAFPVFYFICFLTHTNFGNFPASAQADKFPYFFMDYETLGTQTFSGYILMLMLVMIIINTVIYTLDFIMAQIKKGASV